MSKRLRVISATLVILLSSGPALAENAPIRHGLWQHTYNMRTQSGDLEKHLQEAQELLANLPPEQRQLMEQSMAAHGLALGADGQSIRICISREKAALGVIPQQDGECSYQVTERRDNGLSPDFSSPRRF